MHSQRFRMSLMRVHSCSPLNPPSVPMAYISSIDLSRSSPRDDSRTPWLIGGVKGECERGSRGFGVAGVAERAAAAAVATEMRGSARALLRPRELVSREFRGPGSRRPRSGRGRRVQEAGVTISTSASRRRVVVPARCKSAPTPEIPVWLASRSQQPTSRYLPCPPPLFSLSRTTPEQWTLS